jgi:hypothetical protein
MSTARLPSTDLRAGTPFVRNRASNLLAACAALALAACSAATDRQGLPEGEPSVSALSGPVGPLPACAESALPRVAALSSSNENASLGPALAIDGNPATRWSSAFSDPQWLQVDLGAERTISRVTVAFEYASSLSYDLQVSEDATNWTTVYTQNAGPLGPVTADAGGLDARGRYVRLYSRARTTPYGVSIYELTVYGNANPDCSTYHIDSPYSGDVLDVEGLSTADGANVHQWQYVAGNNQKWILSADASGAYEIRNLNSGKCLDVTGVSTADGANMQQWTCTGGSNQRFYLNSLGANQYQIVAAHSNKCLDVKGWNVTNGGALQQWSCSGTKNQAWNLVLVGSPPAGARKWAVIDSPNFTFGSTNVWNWSTTVSSGGSTIRGGDQYNDIPVSSQTVLELDFTHNGTGLAAANITSSASGEGVPPSSQADRDAGKSVNTNGRLSFHLYSTSHDIRLKLIDASGNASTDVRLGDYEDHCFFNDCMVDVPLSALASPSFDFSRVQSVTVFVDSRVPAGAFFTQVSNVVFRTSSDPVDVESDPENCGGVGHGCQGGACILGACNPTPVTAVGDLACASAMAADDSYVYVGDKADLVRFDLTGGGKTALGSGNTFFATLLRDSGQLFWSDSATISRLNDGQSSATTLYGTPVGQLSLTGETLVGYDYDNARYIAVDRNLSGPGAFTVVTSTTGMNPALSAATAEYLYVVDESSSTVIWQVSRTTGTRVAVSNPGDAIFGITAFGDSVYWTYRDAQGMTGIHSLASAPGSTVEQAVTAVPPAQSVGFPVVDASGIYHSLDDGANNYFYRTPFGNPSRHDVVSRSGYMPNSGQPATTTSNSVVYLDACNQGGGGTVQRFAKP